jgi:maltose alpha-D-glucosyltransferase/alpha-amylase
VLIDFEGEPSRPLVERRIKHCALKDVAGMIRSFDYAVETAHGAHPDRPADVLTAPRLRQSFLDGYLSSAAGHDAQFLPADGTILARWIDFFEMEKALYEVEYEINNRPAWVHIPLTGILRIIAQQT